ncbi:MAG: DUF721 domain-containing protein [Shimia sp.]
MPVTKSTAKATPARRGRGPRSVASLLEGRIRKAGESRGFAETRLLTRWPEIVGPDIAARARPVNVSYAKGGFGATLTLLTTGAHAPMLQMELPRLRETVNAVYGYNAISRIRITQTAPTGFAEGQVAFAPKAEAPPAPDPALDARAEATAAPIDDPDLRGALAALARSVLKTSR